MTMGAAYAALVCMAVLFFVLGLRALSALLPEDPFALIEDGVPVSCRRSHEPGAVFRPRPRKSGV